MSQGNRGFTNIGNTCYMNSALQCLMHLDELNPRNEIFKENIRRSSKKEFTLLKQWIQLYKEMWDENDQTFIQTKPFILTFIRRCQDENIYFEVFNQNESLNKRIRIAEKQRVPMIVVVGDDEVANSKVALRNRRKRERSEMSKEDFLDMLKLNQTGDKI